MTREEKAQEFARNCAEYNNLPIEVEHLLHTAFIAGYNDREDEEKNPWHKASEELPKEDGIYIVMLARNSYVCALEFDAISKQWSIAGYQCDVKYWMPSPKSRRTEL